MTIEELKKRVIESEYKADFDKQIITINLPYLNYQIDLLGIVSIYDYFITQLEGFKKYNELPAPFIREKDNIIRLINIIVSYVNDRVHGLQQLKNNLQYFTTTKTFIPAETNEFYFLMNLFSQNKEYFNGAFNFLIGQLSTSSSRDQFIGSLLAFDQYIKDEAVNRKKSNNTEDSINELQRQLQSKIGAAQQQLTDYLDSTKKLSDTNADNILIYRNAKEHEYNNWYTKHTSDFENLTTEAAKKISDLEELYKAKLRLEAPAKYWNDRAKQLRKEGYWWLAGLVFSVLIGIGILVWILNKTADGTIKEIFSETSTAVKWSVALITLISFLAYIIRVLAKLTFSSFHLVRDAEEREQLTYIYLALQKESKFDNTERHLIMQSLFSRADTGLLKDDASPTMPGNIIDQVIKK